MIYVWFRSVQYLALKKKRSNVVRIVEIPGIQLEFLSRPQQKGMPMKEVVKKIHKYTQ